MIITNNEAVFTLIIRVILGILFFFQGYDKVFKIKMTEVANTFKYELGAIKIPHFILAISAYYTSYIELIGGILLIIGLFTNYALYLIGIDLVLVVGAFSLMKPIWNMELIFPRLILWGVLMLTPEAYNIFSLDFLLR